jgi:hypothetical protein
VSSFPRRQTLGRSSPVRWRGPRELDSRLIRPPARSPRLAPLTKRPGGACSGGGATLCRGPRARPAGGEARGGGLSRLTRPPARSAALWRTTGSPDVKAGYVATRSNSSSLGQRHVAEELARTMMRPRGGPRPTGGATCDGGWVAEPVAHPEAELP